MFFSKIWFFLIAAAAATALTIALVMPRPAERAALKEEKHRIKDSCAVINILLTQNARVRIDLSAGFALNGKVPEILDTASRDKAITTDRNSTGRKVTRSLLDELRTQYEKSAKSEGEKKAAANRLPDFVILLDRQGRVVSRFGPGEWEKTYGDSMKGYHLVDDALDGYQRDDVWLIDETLYRVAAAPAIYRTQLAGAVVVGHDIDREFATLLAKQLPVQVSFYAGGRAVGTSDPVQIHSDVIGGSKAARATEKDRATDCQNEPFTVSGGGKSYSVLTARLPGEAGQDSEAFYSVFLERPSAFGFSGTLGQVKKGDLSMANFPWIALACLFLFVVGLGIFLQIWESDLPLKRLTADAVALAKGEKDRLDEDKHRGKYGSIARSVNIELDKMHREAKSAKKDLDQLLGPAPSSSASMRAAASLPMSGPGGPAKPGFSSPPPSDFQFSDGKPKPVKETPSSPFDLDLPPPPPAVAVAVAEPARPATPAPPAPPVKPPTNKQVVPKPVTLPAGAAAPPPLPRPPPVPPVMAFDDDILASAEHKIPEPAAPTPAPAPKAKSAPAPAPAKARRPSAAFEEEPTTVADPSTALLKASKVNAPEAADAGDDTGEASYFEKVYDEFIALKKKCGESTSNLTFKKFSSKLEKNRAALIAKHGCKEVRFQVYIKDGKAALKASPVKG